MLIVSWLCLLTAAGLAAVPALALLVPQIDRSVTQAALWLFATAVATGRRRQRADLLRSARVSTVYRVYAATSLLYAALGAAVGALLGPHAAVLCFRSLAGSGHGLVGSLPAPLEPTGAFFAGLGRRELFLAMLVSAAAAAVAGGVTVYLYRWRRPKRLARAREPAIDESLPRTVAFMFALSRSGMSQPRIIQVLARHEQYFGAAASELATVDRSINISGEDCFAATTRLARITPSDEFATFLENLSGVSRTGRPLSAFLRDAYERYSTEKRQRQDRLLDQLSALAEVYIALLVAGPVFLITVLVVIDVSVGGTLTLVRLVVYGGLPLVALGFLRYLGYLTSRLGIDGGASTDEVGLDRQTGADREPDPVGPGTRRVWTRDTATGGDRAHGDTDSANRERLRVYNRFRGVRQLVRHPLQSVLSAPTTVLYVAFPLSVAYLTVRSYLAATAGHLGVRAVDDYLIQAGLIALGPFALAQWGSERRQAAVERAVPEFISRVADSTAAGRTLPESISRLAAESVPSLDTHIDRLGTDIALGTPLSEALVRFARATSSASVVRTVVLIINARHASTDVTPVLQIAAEEAMLDRRLARRRTQELLVYRLIVYLAFLVFLGIAAALILVLLPSVPAEGPTPAAGGGAAGQASGVSGVGPAVDGGGSASGPARTPTTPYELVLAHAVIIQAVIAGLTTGKLSTGSATSGATDAFVMLCLGYGAVVFVL